VNHIVFDITPDRLIIFASGDQLSADQQGPRKKQRVQEANENASGADWDEFEQELRTFDIQHVQGKGKFAFAFVEGPLVNALRLGDWYAPSCQYGLVSAIDASIGSFLMKLTSQVRRLWSVSPAFSEMILPQLRSPNRGPWNLSLATPTSASSPV